jgi:DNA-binding response OmpR family regulator
MSQKKILVVDDEAFIRELVKDFLEFENISCEEADDLDSAIDLLSQSTFDLILLDRNLRNYKAEDIIKELRQVNQTIPIVILTGDHMVDEDFLTSINASGIIYKPFQVNEFLVKINSYLEQA